MHKKEGCEENTNDCQKGTNSTGKAVSTKKLTENSHFAILTIGASEMVAKYKAHASPISGSRDEILLTVFELL